MSDESMALNQAVKDAAEAARYRQAPHPDAEVLMAYQERRLVGEETAEIREHLAVCPECTQLVLDLAAFPDVSLRDESLALSPEEEEEDRQLLLRRLAEAASEPVALRPPARRVQPATWLLAASVAAAVVGLGGWLAGIPSPFARPEPAVQAAALLDLYPVAPGSRGGDVDEQPPIPEADTPLVLLLNTTDAGDFAGYELELRAGGSLVLRRADLQPGPKGTFTLVARRSLLPAGSYEICLFGSSPDGERTELARYVVVVRYGDSP